METYYSDQQIRHAPVREMQDGKMVPYAEKPERVETLLKAVGSPIAARDHGLAPLLDVHDAGYVAFLQSAHDEWRSAGRKGDAFPYVFPARGRRPLNLERIDARLGQYAYDCGTPVTQHTWQAAYWNVQTALTALDAVMDTSQNTLALCRPPGHHSGKDYMGGYCYLNNVAIAAQAGLNRGAQRVAILDVDYHHGNGTQDIFYNRGDVLTVSIHADPKTDYPFYWGHADETGSGPGSGCNANYPLPRGTEWSTYSATLQRACEAVGAFKPDLLIVPYGADTFERDPISHFKLKTDNYRDMGNTIAALSLPTLVCMEGGYAVDALGANLASFLSGFADQDS
ncbi:MAG: histone deacetylase family protein [Pseudomonadota bacterium]